MRRTALLLVAMAALLTVPGTSALATDTTTLHGEFVWDDGGTEGKLDSTFTPTGPDVWDVSFRFHFRGRDHVYAGTARGSLSDGALEGKVRNDSKRRTFTFSGSFEDGVFRGRHAEIEDGRAHSTGTLTLAG